MYNLTAAIVILNGLQDDNMSLPPLLGLYTILTIHQTSSTIYNWNIFGWMPELSFLLWSGFIWLGKSTIIQKFQFLLILPEYKRSLLRLCCNTHGLEQCERVELFPLMTRDIYSVYRSRSNICPQRHREIIFVWLWNRLNLLFCCTSNIQLNYG